MRGRALVLACFILVGRLIPASGLATYVTLWEPQIVQWNLNQPEELKTWLQLVREQGVDLLMFSVSWQSVEEQEGNYNFDSAFVRAQAALAAGLRVMVVLDAYRAPSWLFVKHPDARLVGGGPENHNCNMRLTGFASFSHAEAFGLALRFLEKSVVAFAARFPPGSVYGFQPVFNNELEARYPQECDIFQDYGPASLVAYREWLKGQNENVRYWTTRWHQPTSLTWEQIEPPRIWGSSPRDESIAYWDWLRFRQVTLVQGHAHACSVVRLHGAPMRCFLHFGEFFSTIDAINSVAFFDLAKGDAVDDFILDTNFVNFCRTKVNPVTASIMVSAAQAFLHQGEKAQKRIWFEAAVERLTANADAPAASDIDKYAQVLISGVRQAISAGAHGVGYTNVRDVSRVLSTIFPSKAEREEEARPWDPTILLYFPYETFFTSRRWSTEGNTHHDVLQIIVHRAYHQVQHSCEKSREANCQIQIVADYRMLHAHASNPRYKWRIYLEIPGVVPASARNAFVLAKRVAAWDIVRSNSLLRQHEITGHADTVVLPVMGDVTEQALPDFVIAGTPKGGTSTLFNWLAKVPHTLPSTETEINYLDRNFDSPLSWYANFWTQQESAITDGGVALFEATSNYIYHPLVPARAAAVLPHTQFIFVLRDPVTRAHSDHAMWVRQGVTTRTFDDMVAACVAQLPKTAVTDMRIYSDVLNANCIQRGFPRPDNEYGDLCRCYENIVAKGLYAEQLARWKSALSREQLLVLRTEDLADPRGVMAKISNFLSLSLEGLDLDSLEPMTTTNDPEGQYASLMSNNAGNVLAAFYEGAPDWTMWLS